MVRNQQMSLGFITIYDSTSDGIHHHHHSQQHTYIICQWTACICPRVVLYGCSNDQSRHGLKETLKWWLAVVMAQQQYGIADVLLLLLVSQGNPHSSYCLLFLFWSFARIDIHIISLMPLMWAGRPIWTQFERRRDCEHRIEANIPNSHTQRTATHARCHTCHSPSRWSGRCHHMYRFWLERNLICPSTPTWAVYTIDMQGVCMRWQPVLKWVQ